MTSAHPRAPRSSHVIVPVVVIILACSAVAFAQGLSAGAKGGVNLATLTTEDEGPAPFETRIAGVLGGFVTLPALSWLELQTEVLYSMKGARFEDTAIDTRLLLEYLELPVLARVSRGAHGARRFFLAAGPSFGVRLRARTRTEFGDATEEMDISEDVERFDLGVAVGGGLEFGSIVIDARYTHGLSDVDRSEDGQSTNRVLSFTAGLRF